MADGGVPPPNGTTELTDQDLRRTTIASLRLLGMLAVVVVALFWWRSGWQSAMLSAIGAVISGASLWQWQRLMTAVNEQMDAGRTAKPTGAVLFGFVLRLGLTLAVLYGSVRYLHGTVLALAAGLALGVVALSAQALRLLRH